MAALKETAVFVLLLYQVFLVDFVSTRTTKELASLDKKIDRVHRIFLLRAWMESAEREHPGRSKRRARNTRHRTRYNLPYFPLYPMDMPVCMDAERESKSGLCKTWAKSDYCKNFKEVMKKFCAKECKYCKPFSPPACQLSEHGCCWNNFRAHGENAHGCPRCKDSYDRLCKLFTQPDFNFCMRAGIKGKFIRYNCFKSCRWCDNFRQMIANQTRSAI